jgi:hypothetical protein
LTQYVSSAQWYVPRDNPLYTDTQKGLFRWFPGWMRAYRLYLAYLWESEAYKLQGGEGPAKIRGKIEALFVSHMKATAPAKYHEMLTPKYPVSSFKLITNRKRNGLTFFSWDANALYTTPTTSKVYMVIMSTCCLQGSLVCPRKES